MKSSSSFVFYSHTLGHLQLGFVCNSKLLELCLLAGLCPPSALLECGGSVEPEETQKADALFR